MSVLKNLGATLGAAPALIISHVMQRPSCIVLLAIVVNREAKTLQRLVTYCILVQGPSCTRA